MNKLVQQNVTIVPADNPEQARVEVLKYLRQIREEKGITQKQIANALGLDPTVYSKIENDKRIIIDKFIEIAAYLRIKITLEKLE